jgi:Glycosyl transferase family 21
MMARARYDTLVISDSDIAVDSGYLARVINKLSEPGVGAVTCLYHGIGGTSIWARLMCMSINTQFLHNIKKGVRIDVARQFSKNCHELGIVIHGTFILGLPGETKETIEETIRFACEVDPHTLQVSIAAPYPGTYLYRQALENGWLDEKNADLIDDRGVQVAPLHFPHLAHTEIFHSVEEFYRRFYFRAPKIAAIVSEMVRSPQMMQRRLREGIEFSEFLRARRELSH